MTPMELLNLVRYGMGALLVITLPPAILYWFILHPFIGFWRRVGMKGTFWFLAVFMVASMAALFPFHRALLGRDLGTNLWTIVAALPLIVTGGVVSRQRRRHLTFKILAGTPELAPETHGTTLLTEGIYGRIRHPRYVEFTLALAGWALFCHYTGLYAMTAAALLLLYLIVLLEERELKERFGQAYADYSARVPRFLPRLRA